MLVRDLMDAQPGSVTPDATLAEALRLMSEKRTHHLPVMNGGDLVGVLSDHDLAMYYDPVNMTEQRWEQTHVSEIMSTEVVTIGSGATIPVAARLMLKEAVSVLPVVDAGTLVGMLSDRDFTRYFARQQD